MYSTKKSEDTEAHLFSALLTGISFAPNFTYDIMFLDTWKHLDVGWTATKQTAHTVPT